MTRTALLVFFMTIIVAQIYGKSITRSQPDIETECWELCSMDFEKCREFYMCPKIHDEFGEAQQCSSCAKRSIACLGKCVNKR